MSQRLRDASLRLERWLRRDALPLWAVAGVNGASRACHERLLPDGTADLEANLRVRVQARQMFVFAKAHHLGWYDRGRELVCRIMTFVEQAAAHPRSGWGYVHLLDADSNVIDDRQDLYDHAFFILAYACCYRAFGLRGALRRAETLVARLDERLRAANGGWREGDYWADRRRQNPHMHLLEAFLALHEATGESRWLRRAAEVLRLFEVHFYDREHTVVLEYFDADWTPLTAAQGQAVEPGHLMEWVWLLRCYEARTGTPVSGIADALYDRALDIGTCARSGLMFAAVAPDGRVLQPGQRCWPMTECIKAGVAQARAGRPHAAERAADAIDALFEYYLCASTPGAWIDERGPDDRVTVSVSPASTLYHLISAAAEAAAWRTG